MAKNKFAIGDRVEVIGVPSITFPPGARDEMGTKKLFKSMVGKVYTVRGFGKYGHVELKPTRKDTVWIEPEFLKLHANKKVKKRKSR